MAGISGFATGVNLTEGAGGSVSLTGDGTITVDPDPITGTGVIGIDLNGVQGEVFINNGFGGITATARMVVNTGTSTVTFEDTVVALTGGYVFRTQSKTVAQLVDPATAGAGARSFVSDSTATIIAGLGLVVAGGGANAVPVYCDGTDWLIG